MRKFKYSDDFKVRVKSAFQNNPFVNNALDGNDYVVGRILNDNADALLPHEVLDCIRNNKLDELEHRATRLQKIHDLYAEWLREIRQNGELMSND